jgi:hypothetical protein
VENFVVIATGLSLKALGLLAVPFITVVCLVIITVVVSLAWKRDTADQILQVLVDLGFLTNNRDRWALLLTALLAAVSRATPLRKG